MQYTNLHLHTDNSPDGLGTIPNLMDRAKQIGFTHIAITDHGSLGNWISFFLEAKKRDIYPVLGVEAYLYYGGKTNHCTLLTTNLRGFQNLITVQNKAAERSSRKTTLLELSDFEEHNEGIVALTGCPSSAIHKEDFDFGLQYVCDLIRTFGKESVFIELMFPNEEDHHTRPMQIAEKLSLPCVITNDTHFCHKGEKEVHTFCVQARKGFTYDSSELWLKTPEELFESASKRGLPEKFILKCFDNTMQIANSCEEYDIRSKPQLPHIPNVEKALYNQAESRLLEICETEVKILKTLSFKDFKKLKEQFEREFEIFKNADLLGYFYIVKDIHDYCRENNIKIGVRGSAVGCTFSYLLGITDINPLKYGLIFERFYNPKRLDYPDIDTDIPSDKRNEVLEYARKTWGAFPVATDSRYSFKSLIRDIGRILELPKKQVDQISDYGEDSKYFKELCSDNPFVEQIYNSMLGQMRHRGKHAGGIFISNIDVPLERLSDGTLATAWTEGSDKYLFEVGVIKFDFLGLSALAQLADMEKLSKTNAPTEYNDPKVFKLFQRGDTNGVFQWSGSDGIKNFTREVKPQTIEDLIAINALYRPGALDAGTAEKYPEFMQNPRKIHPKIDEILKETYGVICYQEQFMKIFALISNSDFGDADYARKIIANAHKKRKDDIDFWKSFQKLKDLFFKNGLKNGFDHALLEMLWAEIETHGRYSFNKSHSTAYAILGYKMAYFKVYYPAVFYTALMRHTTKKIQAYVFEAIEKGIEVKSPNINKSEDNFTTNGKEIYFPLSSVNYLGTVGLEKIMTEREVNGPFLSYADFDSRIPRKACNKRVRENLYLINAFEGLTGNPEDALDISQIPILTDKEREIQAYGFRIPNREMIELSKKFKNKKGYRFGIVEKIEARNNGYGNYYVVRLSPTGIFWIDRKPNITEGDIMFAKTKNGKLLKGKKIG